jgi:poly(glycerol-phosphate) alpha-glucosyltransferase
MHYFITSQIDTYTSAIEIAEIQRLKLFDDLDQPAAIVTRNYVRDAAQVWDQLGISGRVINLFQYFQGSPDGPMPTPQAVLKQATDVPIENNVGVVDGKTRIKVSTYGNELYYIDYLDKWGFTDRRDFYDQNRLAYS